MRDFDTLSDHPAITEIVDVLCDKTQNMDRNFFRIEAAYFLAKMASSMRAYIQTKDRGNIPINIYALALATSGFGKGHSVSIMESSFLKGFRKRFMQQSFNQMAETHIAGVANQRAVLKNTDPGIEEQKLKEEFRKAGSYPYTFDSGTTPAVKQLRQKLLLADCGAINLQIDEVGSNLLNNVDILNVYLELYDLGKTKNKLTKNTADNHRGHNIEGATPANMLLFGTPAKLLDGGSVEDGFFDFLQIGYARRCIFAYGEHKRAAVQLTPTEVFDRLTNTQNNTTIAKWQAHFTNMADPGKHKFQIKMPDVCAIELIEYRSHCETISESLPDHKEIEKAELNHRYFKVLKLAGVFAFIDESTMISMDHIYYAINIVEDSGRDFKRLLNREKAYEKLAKYIAAHDEEQTHADLYEALPFYKQGTSARNELITLATAWGYKNNIVIKKTLSEGIEFFSGEMLDETQMDKMIFSCSTEFAEGYEPMERPFNQLHKLTSAPGWHWANHKFKENHRRGDNVMEGFNMVVLDVDGTAPMDLTHDMLKAYKFMTYTTKRHTTTENRFRVILPLKYILKLNKADYEQFMNNIMEWLPFSIDEAANQRERKWLTNSKGIHHYNLNAELLDPIRFIPKTSKNAAHHKQMTELKDMSSLERWFAEKMTLGNRNNNMIKFALALVDGGLPYTEVEARVTGFNEKLQHSLSTGELTATVLKTVAKRYSSAL